MTSDFYDSSSLQDKVFPNLHLLVSGGNSQLILSQSWNEWRIVGQTLDDAAGECFDKIGRMLGFSYPAGVMVAKTAKMHTHNPLNLPIGMQKSNDLNYSFSGLKTAVRYLIKDQTIEGLEFEKQLASNEISDLICAQTISDLDSLKLQFLYNVCVSTQTVVVEQLVSKLEKAVRQYNPASLGLSGGVSANQLLRHRMQEIRKKYQITKLFVPDLKLTGDNAVMIGLAGVAEEFYD